MALASQTLASTVVTPTSYAAPTTNETVSAPGPGVHLWVKVGATTTTVTMLRPGNFPAGDAVTDYSTGAIVNAERIIPITTEYKDPATSLATVQFSQVTGVTALLLRVNS